MVAAVVLLSAACSDDDAKSSAAPETGPTVTAVAGQPAGTDQEVVASSEFCSNLGPGGIEDLLGTAPTEVRATDTSCEWTEAVDGGTRELSVTLTPYPTDAEARAAVPADEGTDDEVDPHLEAFTASSVTFSEDGDAASGEVQVASGPAVITFAASGPGLTRTRLTAGVSAVLQG